MIDYVRGRLVGKSPSEAVVEVNGVAFAARISLSAYDKLPSLGTDTQIWVKLFIRDENPELYGFASRDERWVFEELISISGVGPKLALTLLSGMQSTEVRTAIATGDAARLKAVKGIGAKIADRIVLELGKKFAGGPIDWTGGTQPSGSDAILQARQALQSLGLSPAEIDKSLDAARTQDIEIVEDIIKFALRKS